jgi:hypothetical protein
MNPGQTALQEHGSLKYVLLPAVAALGGLLFGFDTPGWNSRHLQDPHLG